MYVPKEDSIRYALSWKYVKKVEELFIDLRRLDTVKPREVITHLHCDKPQVENFEERMKERLGIPANRDHPLLV